jgi:hypothetical protein
LATMNAKGDRVYMSRTKIIVATLLAVFALSAFISSSASAATAGWLVSGTLLTGTQTASLAATAAVDQDPVLKFKGITITCSGSTVNVAEAQLGEATTGAGATFTSCSASGEECALEGQPVNIGTTSVVSEVTLEGSSGTATTFRPEIGTTLATIKFGSGISCSTSGEKLPVTGEAPATEPTGQNERTLQLYNLNISSASGKLKVGSSAASLEGSALLKLASSRPWSFM